MKKIYALVLAVLVLSSCGEDKKVSKNLADLNAKKSVLKLKIDSLSLQLISIEKEISKLDTLKKLALVTTIKPLAENFKHYINVQGVVKADKNVDLHSETGGIVTKIYVKEGQNIKKGAVLAQLDSDIVWSNIKQIQTQLKLATTTFERQSRLWEQKIGSEIQYLQAKTQKESLEANIKTLKIQAKKMKIIAPFSGSIDKIHVKVGQLASPQMPFLRIVNLDKVYIESEVTETYLQNVQKDTEVLVSFNSLGKIFPSKISQVGNFINPNNRSFITKIEVENSLRTLKTNLLADIKINDFEAVGIVIPSNVIREDNKGQHFVYTIKKVGKANKVVKTVVKIGKEYDNHSYISEGLTENNEIISKGAMVVKSGDEVLISNN